MSKPQALCIHNADLVRLAYRCGFPSNPPGGIVLLDRDGARHFANALGALADDVWYIPRSNCETNFDFRQLLPYVVIVDRKGDILSYNRPLKGGGEGRLAGNFSIGFGGHVELQDWSVTSTPWVTCQLAVERELREELSMQGLTALDDPLSDLQHTLAALIISEDSDVDAVHLGVVQVAQWPSFLMDAAEIRSNEPDQVCNLRTLTLEQAKAEASPESWTAKILASGLLDKFVS